MYFSDICGYKREKKLWTSSCSDFAPVQILSGVPGAPILSLALSLIAWRHCKSQMVDDGCRTCSGCLKTSKYFHPDVFFTIPSGSVKNKSLDSSQLLKYWRKFLEKKNYQEIDSWASHLGNNIKNLQIGIKQIEELIAYSRSYPIEGEFKTFLIWQPELLNPSASNKLLKTLEEPPSGTKFLLVSNDPEKILSTVSSRALHLHFGSLSKDIVIEELKKKHPDKSINDLTYASELAAGQIDLANNILENPQEYSKFANWLRIIYLNDWTRLVEYLEEWGKKPLTEQKRWLSYGSTIMRGTLRSFATGRAEAKLLSRNAQFCYKLSKTLSINQQELIVEYLERSYEKINRNAKPGLTLLDASLHISRVLKN